VRAVFFGSIIQISKHDAPADTVCTWLSHLRNSDCYKQEVISGNCHDLAHIVLHRLGDRLANGIKLEAESQKRRREFMRFNLSTVLIMQLNTPVSLYARYVVQSLPSV
jgi:hypothetical protein